MNFMVTAYTDVGIVKENNQDSVLVQVANSSAGKVFFGVICDGMGGLQKGELASATVIRALANWFSQDLEKLIDDGFTQEALADEWEKIVLECNNKIGIYGYEHGIQLGTTVVTLLIINDKYYIMNIGDSRAYCLRSETIQLTKDQTYVQREMDAGRMTPEEARVNPNRNVLLQCVGASSSIVPAFYTGDVLPGDVFMLCSDGFRHVITPDEIYENLSAEAVITEEDMTERCKYLVELNKSRRESDNISVLLARVLP